MYFCKYLSIDREDDRVTLRKTMDDQMIVWPLRAEKLGDEMMVMRMEMKVDDDDDDDGDGADDGDDDGDDDDDDHTAPSIASWSS